MKQKNLQLFNDYYLKECKKMTPVQIAVFLEDFRMLHSKEKYKSKLISIKIPENLLECFKKKAELQGIAYQKQIKNLMKDWLI